jgi:vitamin B12 transporter
MWILVLLLVLWPTSDAFAQTPAAKNLDPVVVTATKSEESLERLGASVTVITEEEMRDKNYTTLEEALRHVPGVDIQRSGGLGKTTSIRIRGAGPQQVQVMVDGLRVKSPTLGVAELSDFALDGVQRIEIVRGPQSTLHGADAIGGVVNIITKKGQGPPTGFVRFDAGTFETYKESTGISGSWKAFSYNFSASHYDTRGYLKNDDATQSTLAGRFDYDFPWQGTLGLKGRYVKSQTDLPFFSTNPTVFDPNSQQQTETWLYNVTYDQKVTDWWDSHVRYGQWLNRAGFQNMPPPGATTTISQIDTERREAEFLNSFRLGKLNLLTVGFEHRDEQGRNRGTFRREINVKSYFFQDELQLWDNLILGGGVRHEENDTFGSATTGRASAVFLIPQWGTRIRAAWGEGFRAPTINDLFFPGFGNPSLQPESSESYEGGLDQRFWDNRARSGFTLFHNQFSNLIQIVNTGGLFIPQNIGRAITEGIEWYGEVDPFDGLTLYTNYTWTKAYDVDSGKPLRRFPQHRWNAGVVFTWDRLKLFAEALTTTKQFESATAVRSYNPQYHRLDFGGSYQLGGRFGIIERTELLARFNNVTDERYSEALGFFAPGFNCLIGLKVTFQ